MAFNSLNFIFVFLPAFLLTYFLVSDKLKNAVILVYGVCFYVIGNINNPINILILLILTMINYLLLYLLILNKKNTIYKKIILIFSIVFNIVVLMSLKLGIYNMTLPIGISFYIFHYISIVVDYYKIDKEEEKYLYNDFTLFNYFSYIVFFPKLTSGPIYRYDRFLVDFKIKKIYRSHTFDGIFMFFIGMGLKVLLSDNVSYIINQINTYGVESISLPSAWIGLYAYNMKLYFDFAGYSMMAIGIGKIIGFNMPDNFNLPYTATSISSFWRRWHITLGLFFRDYVYIPLGGNCNHKNKIFEVRNLLVVWLLTGIWHGLTPNYIIWAMIIWVFIVLEKMVLYKVYDKCKIIGKLVVIIFMPIIMLIFSIENTSDLIIYFHKLFDIKSFDNLTDFYIIVSKYWKIFIIGLVFMTRWPKVLYNKIKEYKLIMILLSILILLLSYYMISIGASDTFKYFSF